jgi:hypothetical protein
VGLLEVVHVLVLNDSFELFYFFALVGSQGFYVDLFEDLSFDLVDVFDDGGVVDLLGLAFEDVAEVVDEVEGLQFLLL